MAKYKKKTSPETIEEAQKIAKATQKTGQTKEQTKLIAQGIQKGIEQYKKQQKAKARELDKKLRQIKDHKPQSLDSIESKHVHQPERNLLPWILLGLSWVGFVIYFLLEVLN